LGLGCLGGWGGVGFVGVGDVHCFSGKNKVHPIKKLGDRHGSFKKES